jgi:4-alpha-glucanotransferase
MVPLFSLRSSQSWGIGEFADLPVFGEWLHAAHQAFVQILPITEVPVAETSPYSALTAMAIDPIYIRLAWLDDFVAIGGESALPASERQSLDEARRAPRVRHALVRALKDRSLRRAYAWFRETGRHGDSDRAARFEAFVRDHAEWLDDYSLFQALRARFERTPWWKWPEPLRNHDEGVLPEARRELDREIEFRKYVQWIAAEQWAAARRAAEPLQIFGDVPFMISADSPDVWTRQSEFRFDATVGVPPDAFSDTGQDWGLPPWRWEAMAANDFTWMRQRARRTAELFDGFRLDHLVGLYRTYIRPLDKSVENFFAPPDQPAQKRLGERLVSIYRETGAEVIAEDLGTVPQFVRESLHQLQVPGFKVMRWERLWSEPGKPYVDPGDYPAISVATTGTHDTEPLAGWWESLTAEEQHEVRSLPGVQRHVSDTSSPLDAIVAAVLNAPSELVILPLQDVFGWPDRVNTPAVIQAENWSWVLPWPVDRMLTVAEGRERAQELARWTIKAGRVQAGGQVGR